ncbi:hypothetical protein [Pseudaestuariivita atlantica]|uniref:Uncharacterized protein n=1 Tax=Pseudaestuariivita atlantica TaxID=1317121 RepID=A0A0L1JMJ4_9RHOB|nr:hypothetical protein [Pseudaestuariivita atlantica]KNG92643.1 hypothetical protein ATO11_16640 [Pseudaestuariivita atlantica]
MTDDTQPTGPGTTTDPNQADRTGTPRPDPHANVPETSDDAPSSGQHPGSGPGTTSDPNQADRT